MATRRHRSCIAAQRVPGGSAQSASSRAMVDGGNVWSAYAHCRVFAAAEGNGAGSAGSRRRTQTMTEGNVAGSARSRHRKNYLAEGNHGRSASFRRRYYAMRIVNRRRRSQWALDRGNLCCVIGHASNRYTSTFGNQKRCLRQCRRRSGRVYRTAVELSISGTECAKLVRVRTTAPVMGGFKGIPGAGAGTEEAGEGGIPPW